MEVDDDDDDGPTSQQSPEEGMLVPLAPALESLRVALAVAGRERSAGQRAQGTFRRLLREVCGWKI